MKRLAEQAAYIATLEPDFRELSDDELRGKTVEFRERLANGEELEDVLFEAFAAVREARLRESDQRIFDVQMMGGIVLHEGDIAEMKTGEGKTFVASLPLYLNALADEGVHLVTVNDYLAQRDAEWNRPVFERLGITVAAIESNMSFEARKDGLQRRHHLRHQLRVRLRLPARQHVDQPRGRRPARPQLRDRGRGRLDPRRRGAHAADHLRRADDRGEALPRLRARGEGPRRRPVQGHEGRGRGARSARTTTSTTRSTRRSRRTRRGSRRSSARSRSTTSTARATCSSSTT